MAASFKTPKSELVAIYRLEFYKKQKNWKFCTTERKKEEERREAAKKANANLNLTYSIEPAPERDRDTAGTETEEVKLEKETEKLQLETDKEDSDTVPTEEKTDNLNEAFVDSETDDNATTPLASSPPTGPYSPKWSIQQWAARCRPVWNCEPTYPHPQFAQNYPIEHPVQSDPSQQYVTRDSIQPYHAQGQVDLRQVLTDYETDLLYKTKDMPRCDTNLPHGANMLDVGKLRDYEQLGSYEGCEQLGSYEGCEQGWPRQTQVWNNQQGGWYEEICDIPEEAIEAIEALEVAEADAVDGAGGEWGLLARGGDWLGSPSLDTKKSVAHLDQVAMCRSDSLPSLSSGSFCRGAAGAPHSSELDLRGEGEGEGAAAGALSAPALAHAVAAHAAALHALLSEARRRDLQVSPPPVDQLYSFDEYPPREMGPAPHTYDAHPPPAYTPAPAPGSVYPHNPTIANDVLEAGSFKNRPDLCGQSEGVGRGRGRKVGVIGIEMGRPYRL